MQEFKAMSPAGENSRSPLDKPLHLLTEDDISQITREDCRRFLKQKGMRKPSWNKSQAIQQVISLKTLLEAPPDSDAAEARKKLRVVSDSAVWAKKTTADAELSVPAEESAACQLEDDSVSPRNSGSADELVGQMTIFYCGKVNVYNDMPGCKAKAILELASNELPCPQSTNLQNSMLKAFPSKSQAADLKGGLD